MTALEKETKLRALLEAKPESAKLMAQLSVFFMEQAKENKNDTSLQKEALSLARQSVLACSTRPIGYLALSLSADAFEERMEALQRAIDLWTPACSMTRSALAGALLRLLVEPREEEARNVRGQMSTTELQHPSRRSLNDTEAHLYQRIQDTLQQVWKNDAIKSQDSRVAAARMEYRLGRFFRKLLPAETYRPRYVHHLTTVVERLPEGHLLKTSAQFWLATQNYSSTRGSPTITVERCPKEYVVSLYSTFADNFDSLLVQKLHYETPTKLRELLQTSLPMNQLKWTKAADLGCGTGLSGLAFMDCVDTMIGVDLSPEMIDRAKERNCYDSLVVGDVESILTKENEYDLVFACDVFCYIGNLAQIFQAVKKALQPDGVFVFSTEHLQDDQGGKHPYGLHECARFAHAESYIESLAVNIGFNIVKLMKTPIRKNAGNDVEGMLVVMQHQISVE